MLSKVNLWFIGVSFLTMVSILLSAPESNQSKSNSKDESNQAIAALFGPVVSSTSRSNTNSNNQNSLFDSDFWKEGQTSGSYPDDEKSAYPEEEPEILETVSEGNPLNPQTGMPYTDIQMEQFESLQKKFPGNSIIPQRITPDRQDQITRERENMVAVQQRMTSKTANADDITTFYDFQMKGMKDRAQLLDYVLDQMGKDMDDDMKSKFNEVLQANKRNIESLENEKRKAIKEATGH
ncbi:MAG: hypothetical protein H3C43_07005 [Leptonema sp. (in: Bacteria)]|nr:hypothetical protein [Leptonema sp. (in: bacteria)]